MSGVLQRVALEVDARIDGVKKAFDEVGARADTLGRRVGAVTGGAGGLDSALQGLGGRLSGFSSALSTTGGAAGVAVAAFVALTAAAAKASDEVDQSLKRVSQGLTLDPGALDGLRTITRDVASYAGRGRAETAALLAEITANGPGSVAGLEAIARASLDLADALNGDVGSVAAGLDGVLDGFGVAAERAPEVAAALYAVSKGKVPIADLLDVLGKIAPAVQEAGLDLRDVLGYVSALLERNYTGKQVVTELRRVAEAGADGARDLKAMAGAVPPADEALRQLEGAAGAARDNLQSTGKAIREELVGALADLGGGDAGKSALAFLKEFRTLVQGLTQEDGQKLATFFRSIGQQMTDAQPGAFESGATGAGGLRLVTGAILRGIGGSIDISRQRAPQERVVDIDRTVRNLLGDLGANTTNEGRRAIQGNIDGLLRERAQLLRIVQREAAAATTAQQKAAAAPLQDPAQQGEGRRLGALRAAVKPTDLPLEALQRYRKELQALADEAKTPAVQSAARQLVDDLDKRVAAAADRARTTFTQLQAQQTAVRQAFASATAAASPDDADNFDTQVARLVAQARAAKLGTEEIGALVADLERAAGQKLQALGDRYNDDLLGQLVRGTKSAVDDAERAYDQFVDDVFAKLRDGVPVNVVRADKVAAQKAALIDITRAAEALDKQLAALSARTDAGGGRVQETRELLTLLDAARAEADDTTASEEKRAAAAARVRQIQTRLVALAEAQAKANADTAEETAAIEAATARVANKLASWASIAAAVVTAFKGVNSEVAQLLLGVSSSAKGIADLAAQAKQAGGLGNLLKGVGADGKRLGTDTLLQAGASVAGIVTGGAQIISALQGVFAKREPTAQERADLAAREANIKALEENTRALGGNNVSDTGIARARVIGIATSVNDALDADRNAFTQSERERQEREGVDFQPGTYVAPNARQLLDKALAAAGLSFAQFVAQAKAMDITITETAEGLAELAGVALTTGSKFEKLEDDVAVYGLSATERVRGLLDIYATLANGISDEGRKAAAAIRDTYDLTTTAGRDAAIAFIRDQYRAGAFNAETAKSLIDGITAIGTETASAAEEAARKIDAAFGKLADALRRIDFDRQILGLKPEEVIRQTVAQYRDLLPEAFRGLFDGLLDGLDLSTADGRSEAKRRAQDIYRGLLADGVLDETETKIAEGIVAILGQIDDLGTGLEEQGARARDRVLQRADQDSALRDEEAPAAFRRKALAYASVFPEIAKLLEGLDLTTADGIAEADKRVAAFFDTLTDEQRFGPIGEALLTIESLADGAAAALLKTGDALQSLGDALGALDVDARREGLTSEQATTRGLDLLMRDPRLAPLLTGIGAGNLGDALAPLRGAYGTATGQDRETIGQALDFVLARLEAATVADPDAFVPTAEPQTVENTQFISAAQSLTEATGITLADLARSEVLILRNIEQILRAQGGAQLQPPQLPPAGGFTAAANIGGGAAPVGGGGVVVNVRVAGPFYGVSPATAETLGGAISGGIARSVNDALGQEWRDTQLASGDNTRGLR